MMTKKRKKPASLVPSQLQNPRKKRALSMKANGESWDTIIKAVGIKQGTKDNWIADPVFQQMSREAAQGIRVDAETSLQLLALKAVEVLGAALSGEKTTQVQLKAAQDVLHRIGMEQVHPRTRAIIDVNDTRRLDKILKALPREALFKALGIEITEPPKQDDTLNTQPIIDTTWKDADDTGTEESETRDSEGPSQESDTASD